MCDGRDSVWDSTSVLKNIVTIDADRHAQVSASPCGCPLQRALSIGEGSAEPWGKAPTTVPVLDGRAPWQLPRRAQQQLLMAEGCQKCFCVTLDKSNRNLPSAKGSEDLKRTISVEIGKGSVNHNSRKFTAANVDGERSCRNIDYCNEPIQQVYHALFDDALERYNSKQTRADRRIVNYYEKIRSGKQEKPFHEVILQIGNKDDMSATGEHAELSRDILDEYYQGFQQRNPTLRVFSAHLHMDEATPHLHIDFVPFITGSSRGLDTRVSLKQALAALGFKGGTRGATEWGQWVQAEKEQLAAVMERHGIEWEQKGTHNRHLSVMDFKKQEREKELAELDDSITERQDEFCLLREESKRFADDLQDCILTESMIDTDPDYQLPEPSGLMTAKTYKLRFVDGLVDRLKKLVRTLLSRYLGLHESYLRVNQRNGQYYRENERLRSENARLSEENSQLRAQNRDYAFLRKVLGRQYVDALVNGAHELQEQKRKRSKALERG